VDAIGENPLVERRAAERWKNGLGGTVLLSALLLFPAVRLCLGAERVSLWMLWLVVPAGALLCGLLELALRRPYTVLSRRLTAWSIRSGGVASIEVMHFRGVPLLAHWSFFALPVALLPGALIWPAAGGATMAAISVLIVIHELGHAAAARWLGCGVERVELYAMMGRTVHTPPATERASVLIAWAGVLIQVLVALPAWAVLHWRPPAGVAAQILLTSLGPFSLAVAAFNLLPVPGLDGAVAWRVLRRRRRWGPSVVRFPRR